VLVSNNNICGATTKGLSYLSRHLDVPLVFCDVPFVYDEPLPHVAEYVYRQLQGTVAELERLTGHRLDRERLHDLWVARGVATDLLEDAFRLGARRPAPFDALDLFLFYTAYLMLEPGEEMIQLFAGLLGEVARSSGGRADELRLLWHYLPIYNQKRFFRQLFTRSNAVVATATFLWPDEYKGLLPPIFQVPVTRPQLDARTREVMELTRRTHGDPLRWLADFMLLGDVNRNIDYKKAKFERIIEDFSIDGVIMHADRGCRPQTLPQHALKNHLTEKLGLPVLVFDSDPMDDRHFSPAQVTTRFEAFFESLRSRPARRPAAPGPGR
jgi:benzoyl-CoA reductase/2-hydroxyglutaryl-CoA dehydratase subunit BcrC/BadD/HgdB